MLSEREAEREERRATNLIWNAAGDYSLHPGARAYDAGGYADVYMNSIVGAVYKYYDFDVIQKLLDGMENAPHGETYQDLFWTGLENCAYLRAAEDRPALRLLRLGYARGILRQAEGKNAMDFSLPDRIKLEHYSRALGEGHRLIAREERLLSQLEFPPELTSAEIVERMRAILAEYFGVTGGMLRRESRGKLPQFMSGFGFRRPGLGARVRTGDMKKAGSRDRRGAIGRLTGEKSPEQLREYVADCFGVSIYGRGDLEAIEDRLCRDKHAGCMLHFTRGEEKPGRLRDGEALMQRRISKRQTELNRKYYMDGLTAHRLAIIRLTEKVRNCILVHLDDAMLKSRAGQLDARAVWRAVYLNDGRIFEKHERTTDTELSVDVLLDASASQLQRQESVAAQAYILSESLTRCGLPVRVFSFCTVGDCTVVRIYRDYGESRGSEAVFGYSAAGFNRDGLAIRAANYMLSDTPYEHRVLITLSDCSPNDVKRITGPDGRKSGYEGRAGVEDSAMEVEKLRRMGVRVMCVFTGEESELPNARRIYGRELVRIRHISQFADAVGTVLTGLIGSM
ncbi:MAG TPA: hypothetical protein IAB77_08365 [Candidatus Scatomorpha intestinavium]|uniref:Nitric oxide reductase activation protein n=1 Tax=Candidatus Scatomorpha intestinavium TaxID=2840922 RepID=A0A9D0ZFE6_9FIRM|nr:hypothetical protein [Candidatus Scatomorpha intestinavium]